MNQFAQATASATAATNHSNGQGVSPASGLPVARIQTKGELFRKLNMGLIINNYGLPEFVYRADLIPEDILSPHIQHSDRRLILEGAELPIVFIHGYPAVLENSPFWERLPYEPTEAYDQFLNFLELPEKTNHETPIRLLTHIAEISGKSIATVTEWCHLYYWHYRSRAYDLFLQAAHRKQREQRVMSIEGKHFVMAEKALEKINKLVEAKLDKEIREITEDPNADTDTKLKDLVTMSKDLIAIQRISVGLPANGIEKLDVTERGPKNATASETFKHLAKEGAGEEQVQNRSSEMDNLLQSPEDLATMQKLLVRAQRPAYVPPAWDSGKVIDVESEIIVETTSSETQGERPTTAHG